jgi:hypothetical protein
LLHLVVDDDYTAAQLALTLTSKGRFIISATRYNLQLPTGHPFWSKYPSSQALYILGQGLKIYGNAVYGPTGLLLNRKRNW